MPVSRGHRLLTMIHIAPGLLFILLGAAAVCSQTANRNPQLHRWIGRVVLVSGLIIGSFGSRDEPANG